MRSSEDPPPLWRMVLTPRWSGLLLLALAIAAVMSVMGVWQLDVYQSKTAAATAKRAEGAPVALQSLFSIDEGLPSKAVGRRVTVAGTWGPAADQILVTDRRQGTADGLWVVSPVMLPGGGAVMVVRGWVPSATSPAVTAPTGPVQLSGSVVSSEAEDSSDDAAKGRTLSSLRIPTIVHLVDYRLYDAFVIQSSVDAGVVPSPAPAIVTPPSPPTDHAGLRNIAYAFQWWVFAAFTLWMWTKMLLDARHPPDDADPMSDEAGAASDDPDPTPGEPGPAPGSAGPSSGEPGPRSGERGAESATRTSNEAGAEVSGPTSNEQGAERASRMSDEAGVGVASPPSAERGAEGASRVSDAAGAGVEGRASNEAWVEKDQVEESVGPGGTVSA